MWIVEYRYLWVQSQNPSTGFCLSILLLLILRVPLEWTGWLLFKMKLYSDWVQLVDFGVWLRDSRWNFCGVLTTGSLSDVSEPVSSLLSLFL